MADYSFDRFLDGLHDALIRAQTAGRRQRERLLQSQFGESGEQTITFSVPTLDHDGWSTLHIPMIDLLQRRDVGITELTVEIECELQLRAPAGSGDAPSVVVRVCGDRRARGALHRLRMVLRGIEGPEGEVFVDDVLLRGFAGGDAVTAFTAASPLGR